MSQTLDVPAATPTLAREALLPLPAHASVVIAGSGFSGLGMAIGLAQRGVSDFVVLERAAEMGGTWRDNSYPGCACDVPSHLYSYSFAPNPTWTNTFSPQREIQDYLLRVAADHDVRTQIRFRTALLDATWDERRLLWVINTSRGTLTANALVSAVGPLAEPSIPDLKGLSTFTGPMFHSATWDHDVDLTGKQVAVIGTGASAIQFVPKIAAQVGHLTLLQRTPPWLLPRRDRDLTGIEKALYRRVPAAQMAMRAGIYWAHEVVVLGLSGKTNLLAAAQKQAVRHLHRQVCDPVLRAKLTPTYKMGCKRILQSNTYFPALAQGNADVVTEGIEQITPEGVRTTDGVLHEADVIIFGTGFHVTDLPVGAMVRGVGGTSLDEVWEGSPAAYRGTTVAGFPNFFTMVGPNTGLGHTSIIFMIESQVPYICGALEILRRGEVAALDVRPEAQLAFNADIDRRMTGSVWTDGGCKSWYLDSTGRNSTLWPDFTFRYRSLLRRFDRSAYKATPARAGAAAHAVRRSG